MDHQPDALVGEPVDDVPEREPDEHCNARRTRDGTFIGYCKRTAGWGTDDDDGRCSSHGGSGGSSDDHEGNDWAATHGAYSESFVQDFLTEDEIKRVEQAREVLKTPQGAQEDARLMAAIAKEQFRRTSDERFLRRYESICDTFGIAPEDVEHVEVDGSLEQEVTVGLDEETDRRIGQLMETLEDS